MQKKYLNLKPGRRNFFRRIGKASWLGKKNKDQWTKRTMEFLIWEARRCLHGDRSSEMWASLRIIQMVYWNTGFLGPICQSFCSVAVSGAQELAFLTSSQETLWPFWRIWFENHGWRIWGGGELVLQLEEVNWRVIFKHASMEEPVGHVLRFSMINHPIRYKL